MITIEVTRTFRCDAEGCSASAVQRAGHEGAFESFPEGWTARINRERLLYEIEQFCPEHSLSTETEATS